MKNTPLPYRHASLALLVVFIWGTNFVVIKVGLAVFPPFLFATLRFALCAVPLVFLVPRPNLPLLRIAGFGALQGIGVVGLMYLAMKSDISPGLASLVIQVQVFFTIAVARLGLGEALAPLQPVALGLAASAIAVIAWQSAAHATTSVTLLGLGLTLGAGASWATVNIASRSFARINSFHLIAWSSVFAALSLLVVSLLVEGWQADLRALRTFSPPAWGAVLWQSWANTLFGFGTWSWLMGRYRVASVTPFALLVPVFGIATSAALMGESLPTWKTAAVALLMFALGVNFCASKARQSLAAPGRKLSQAGRQ
jgi:O-acetylserine/cysteine efflux transporter